MMPLKLKPTAGWPKFDPKNFQAKDKLHIPVDWMVNLAVTLPKEHFGARDGYGQYVPLHEDDQELLLTDFEFGMREKQLTVSELLGNAPPWMKNPIHVQQVRKGVYITPRAQHEAFEHASLMEREEIQCGLICETFDQVKKTTTHHPYNEELKAVKEYPLYIDFGGELNSNESIDILRFIGGNLELQRND
ncbi:hypothetical protein L596_029784 [Steinernema carpocapsae]|uniref:Uncharacterized protein n=1 Tax=Steinernema carpocapsae TaxID=34508 RepID=A0A4U5LQT3_STECR|nr:hypothetical protein L596_029784 [Steinernema carpocapsae]